MSDEESFVILGSSPTPSMEAYSSVNNIPIKRDNSKLTKDCSIENELKKISLRSHTYNGNIDNSEISNASFSMLSPSLNGINSIPLNRAQTSIQSDKINSAPDPVCNSRHPLGSINLTPNKVASNSLPPNLATKFLLGEINSETIKESVLTQFPSLCTSEPNTGDIIKLQLFINEYEGLKENLRTTNSAMRQHFALIQKWQNDMKAYKEEQREQMAKLRNENAELRTELESKLEIIKVNEEIMKRENADLIQSMSEKTSVINNLSAHIEKLENQQHMSYEIVKNSSKSVESDIEHEYVLASEHKRQLKEIERKLSAVTAENLQFQDMKKMYIDEIDCLKVNLVSAEELLKKAQADINVLKSKDMERGELFEKYEKDKDALRQEVDLLKAQLEVYRTDFEMERTSRENLAGEKEQLISDIKMLQRRNQELTEECARIRSFEAPTTSASPGGKLTLSSRTGPKQETGEFNNKSHHYICPICSVRFTDLTSLEYHIQSCLDKA